MDKIKFFSDMTPAQVGILLFRLLKNKDDFLAKEITDIDDDGKKIKKLKTGPEQILEAISGSDKESEIVTAILKCYGLGQPLIDKSLEAAKKKTEVESVAIRA